MSHKCNWNKNEDRIWHCLECHLLYNGILVLGKETTAISYHSVLKTINIDESAAITFVQNGIEFLDWYPGMSRFCWWCNKNGDTYAFITFNNRVVIRSIQKQFLRRRWKRRLIQHRLHLPLFFSLPHSYFTSFLR